VGSGTSGRAGGERAPWLLDDLIGQRLRNLGHGKHAHVHRPANGTPEALGNARPGVDAEGAPMEEEAA
jgi:hypothetical protein